MPVVAVVNRKGGSGKSTLAAHIAAWCAKSGSSVMLGDIDQQQSARKWLKRRDQSLPAIVPWAVDQKNMLRVPSGMTHVVLDTPGGLRGFELARVVMSVDAIIMPVCDSMFDRESAAACHAELMTLPRIASGRCRLVTVGMRIDERSRSAQTLREWSEQLSIPFLGFLRETQLYLRSQERGMTIFDLPPQAVAIDLEQWEPILQWLRPVLYPQQSVNESANDFLSYKRAITRVPPSPHRLIAAAEDKPAVTSPVNQFTHTTRLGSSLPSSLMPAQESLMHGSRLSMNSPGRFTGAPVVFNGKPAVTRNASFVDRLHIPQFLKRVPA